MALFGSFHNGLIFLILVFLGGRFCVEQLQCVVETVLACFFTFLFFERK